MEVKEINQAEVCRIIDRYSGEHQGSYERGNYMKYDFKNAYKARLHNYHGVFMDENKYKINKYKVTYELIEEDCDIEEDLKGYYEKHKMKRRNRY